MIGEATVDAVGDTGRVVPVGVAARPSADPLAAFAVVLSGLPISHHRRLALMLAQLGMLITVACMPVSIAGMNIGLTTALAGALVMRAPVHRCAGAQCYLAYLVWLLFWCQGDRLRRGRAGPGRTDR